MKGVTLFGRFATREGVGMDYVGIIAPVVAVLVALQLAFGRRAQIRARGNKVSWQNTWRLGLASIVITAASIALFYGGIVTGQPVAGVAVCLVVMVVGQIVVSRAIARRWPVEIPREKPKR